MPDTWTKEDDRIARLQRAGISPVIYAETSKKEAYDIRSGLTFNDPDSRSMVLWVERLSDGASGIVSVSEILEALNARNGWIPR